jgi:hypothetical protein
VRRTPRVIALIALIGGIVVGVARPAVAAPVSNGGFESGTLGGWTEVDQPGSDGGWLAYQGTSAPDSGSVLPAPPEGTFAAITDQLGHGSHVLYQDLTVDPAASTLELRVFYVNQADRFVDGPGLDFMAGENQRFRVDVLRAGADPFSVDPADIVATAFSSSAGSALELPATVVRVDLAGSAGQTVRLRAAEVDTLQFLNAGVDAVTFLPTPTPSPSTTTLLPPASPAMPVLARPAFTG